MYLRRRFVMANAVSCGCLQKKRHDLTGTKFGRWTVVKFAGTAPNGIAQWLCRCACGTRRSDCGGYRTASARLPVVADVLLVRTLRRRCAVYLAESIKRRTLPHGQSAARAVFKRYQQGAKKRGLPFELSFDVFLKLTSSVCFYCGAEPSCTYGTPASNGDYTYTGIDRLQNDNGYVEGNVAPCCKFCNSAKRTLGLAEFLAWIERVYQRRIAQ